MLSEAARLKPALGPGRPGKGLLGSGHLVQSPQTVFRGQRPVSVNEDILHCFRAITQKVFILHKSSSLS